MLFQVVNMLVTFPTSPNEVWFLKLFSVRRCPPISVFDSCLDYLIVVTISNVVLLVKLQHLFLLFELFSLLNQTPFNSQPILLLERFQILLNPALLFSLDFFLHMFLELFLLHFLFFFISFLLKFTGIFLGSTLALWSFQASFNWCCWSFFFCFLLPLCWSRRSAFCSFAFLLC